MIRFLCTKIVINAMTPSVRVAVLTDMPKIHNLISDSFAAMKKFVDPDVSYENEVKSLIEKGDLNTTNFENAYLKPPNCNYWVLEHPDTMEVCGCVALTQLNPDEAELKRMSVSPSYRGQNFGGTLISNLLKFAEMKGFQRIILTTANPDAMRFYLKHQFVVYQSFEFKMKTTTLMVYKMICYINEKKINRVAIVGGTHGNERIGVKLVEEWESSKQGELTSRSTLAASVLYGNTKAIALNRRFIDSDLNRQFILNEHDGSFKVPDSENNIQTYESARAMELNDVLGPKLKQTGPLVGAKDCVIPRSSCGSDFIVDLHSTECDVGTLLMISGEDDCIAYRVAHHIQSMEAYKNVHITCSRGNKDCSYSVDSISPSGIAVEVGPLAHGTVNEVLLERTRGIVFAILDFLESHNQKVLIKLPSTTAPESFPNVNYFKFLGAVKYPDIAAASQKVILHPSFSSNHELKPLKDGDLVFQFIDGGASVIDVPFTLDESLLNQLRSDRHNKVLQASEITVYPAFIGEPSYIASANAFYLYTLETRSLY